MPYKTRAAKIAATQRRFTYIQAKQDGSFSYEKKHKNEAPQKERKNDNMISDKLYLKGDLLKIVITLAVIIAFQILLSLTLF